VQRTPRPARKTWAVQKDAGSINYSRCAFRRVTKDSLLSGVGMKLKVLGRQQGCMCGQIHCFINAIKFGA
jgi:hypothetical protein